MIRLGNLAKSALGTKHCTKKIKFHVQPRFQDICINMMIYVFILKREREKEKVPMIDI